MLSWLTFSWIRRVVLTAYKNEIKPEDIWDMDEINSCKHVSDKFERKWNAYVLRYRKTQCKMKNISSGEASLNDPKPSLIYFIFKHNMKSLSISAINKLIADVLLILGPLILEYVKFKNYTSLLSSFI